MSSGWRTAAAAAPASRCTTATSAARCSTCPAATTGCCSTASSAPRTSWWTTTGPASPAGSASRTTSWPPSTRRSSPCRSAPSARPARSAAARLRPIVKTFEEGGAERFSAVVSEGDRERETIRWPCTSFRPRFPRPGFAASVSPRGNCPSIAGVSRFPLRRTGTPFLSSAKGGPERSRSILGRMATRPLSSFTFTRRPEQCRREGISTFHRGRPRLETDGRSLREFPTNRAVAALAVRSSKRGSSRFRGRRLATRNPPLSPFRCPMPSPVSSGWAPTAACWAFLSTRSRWMKFPGGSATPIRNRTGPIRRPASFGRPRFDLLFRPRAYSRRSLRRSVSSPSGDPRRERNSIRAQSSRMPCAPRSPHPDLSR